MNVKKRNVFLVIFCLVLALTFTGCGSDSDGDKDKAATPFEKHAIAYPDGYKTDEAGASSYDSYGDHFDSPYWKPLDVYNMKSKDSFTVIPEFKTYQQTTEYTCGACSALMVLNHYGVKDYDEMTIAKKSKTSDTEGVGVDGLAAFFKEIGWNVERSKAGEYTFDYNNDENAPANWIKWVQKNLKNGTPIMIDWVDWAGHWQVIIGYDTMGTDDNMGDDVMIVADPYDTSDHYQDGYYTVGAERFFYMWKEGVTLKDKPEPQPWVIATPPEKTE